VGVGDEIENYAVQKIDAKERTVTLIDEDKERLVLRKK
jgi:hypothetical protein